MKTLTSGERNKPTMNNPAPNTEKQFEEVIALIEKSKQRAIYAVNKEMIELYWAVGAFISKQISSGEWGRSIVTNLSKFIAQKTPGLTGFSDKNLWRMRQFYETYVHSEKLSPLVREISWTNNLVIIGRAKSEEERAFYLGQCIKEGFSKRELERQFETSLFERTKLSGQNLSPLVRDFAPAEVFRDSYVLEFLNLSPEHSEKDLRKGLVQHLKAFILELGKDFSFVGEEYRLQVGNSDFFIDLLFFHRELQCLVAFELKAERFRPEHMGQLNFYLEALDRDVKKAHENPSIGILLCKGKDEEVVEYALNRSLSPALVADYQTKLPDKKLLQQKFHELIIQTKSEND